MAKKYPSVSIIIPLYKKTPYFFEAVNKCLELDYPDFEILVGVDKGMRLSFQDKRVRVLETGELRTGPAEKRDIGIVKARGELVAFLDDDSYPAGDWLKKAIEVLNKKKVTGVCGPGLTPPEDSFSQKLTGAVIASRFGSGPYYYRFTKGSPRFVDDYPAYNMLVRKDTLLRLGGFGTKFYGGEDTALLIKLINAGERIYYHPDIVVYHHRRKFPFEYSRQVGNVGLHRGYFVKAYPQTSLRPSYFIPALLTVGLPIGILWGMADSDVMNWIFWLGAVAYLAIFGEGIGRNKFVLNLFLPFAVLIHHLAYGVQFIRGFLFIKELER